MLEICVLLERVLAGRPTIGEPSHTVTGAHEASRTGVRARVYMGRGVAGAAEADLLDVSDFRLGQEGAFLTASAVMDSIHSPEHARRGCREACLGSVWATEWAFRYARNGSRTAVRVRGRQAAHLCVICSPKMRPGQSAPRPRACPSWWTCDPTCARKHSAMRSAHCS